MSWPPPNAPFADHASAWVEWREGQVARKSWLRDRHDVRRYLPHLLADLPLNQITALAIEDATIALLRAGRSPKTVRRSLSTMRSICARLHRLGLLPTNPALDIPTPRGTGIAGTEIHPLSYTALTTLAARHQHLSRWGDLTLVLGLTGIRWGELRGLTVANVTLDGPMPALRITRSWPDGADLRLTKSGRARTVPLLPELVPLLERWTDGKPADRHVFATTSGNPIQGSNFRRAVKWRTSAPGLRIHDLRHTAATLWLSSGIDPKTAQKWLGHASATLTLDLYGHFMGDDADKAALIRLTEKLHPTRSPAAPTAIPA